MEKGDKIKVIHETHNTLGHVVREGTLGEVREVLGDPALALSDTYVSVRFEGMSFFTCVPITAVEVVS